MAMTEEERRSVAVDLSPEEAENTLRKLDSLWGGEKQTFRDLYGVTFVRSDRDVAGRFSDWVRLLAEVIFPRLSAADQATKELAVRFVDELDEAGVQILYTLPALLYLDEDRSCDVADRLWSGMESEDPDEAREAIRGIILWVTFRARGAQLPSPPDHLLDEVVSRTLARKMPGLDTALIHLTNLLRLHPEQLQARHLDDLCNVLRYLKIDTRLPSVQEQRELGSIVDRTIQVSERPRYRVLSASLASRLAAYYSDEDLSVPEILNQWKEASSKDTLPEVRVAWHKENKMEGT